MGRRRPAARCSELLPASYRVTAHTASGVTRSAVSAMASSVSGRSTLLVMRSNTRRSPMARNSARLRSVMSVMLPRTSRLDEEGSRTSRTSQGISWPDASQWVHSKHGASPASARSMWPRATPNDGVPSACTFGLMRSGPLASSSSRVILKKRTALSLHSTKRPRSTSNTTIASGAFSTSVR